MLKINKNGFIKPAWNHTGNKSRMMKSLLDFININNIENFVDVFSGSGVVSVNINSNNYYLNDYDPSVIKLLNLLTTDNFISKIDNLVKEYNLETIPYKEGYYRLRNHYNNSTEKSDYELFVLVLFGFNQQIRFNKSGNVNNPAGKTLWTDYQKEKITKFIVFFKEKNINISNLDFEEFVEETIKKVSKEETVFYFDPPYLISNATYNKMWNNATEERLINLLKKLDKQGYKWVLSNVISMKGKSNNLLIKFIEENNFNILTFNGNYKNCAYIRKKYTEKDIEIILKNY